MTAHLFFAHPLFLYICLVFITMIVWICSTIFDKIRNKRPLPWAQVNLAGLDESFDSGICV